ncbi:hypothetical protein H7H51_07410 [Mycolicibacterium farcinogenes]|nr:hypothetical protein [Mycolicibacterium farcinogenes]
MTSQWTDDERAILQLHKDWWESNCGLDVERMRSVFAKGDSYLMFNLDGHPYFSVDELAALWQWYRGRIEIGMAEVYIMRLDVAGDFAYICAEGNFPSKQLRPIGEDGTPQLIGESEQSFPDIIRMRATEIYKRDDGEGNRRWSMWHFHCSPIPPADEPRPSPGDTSAGRGGLGSVPHRARITVVGAAT